MILDANGTSLSVADEVDENGAIDLEMDNSFSSTVFAALTVRQAKELAKHLLDIVAAKEEEGIRIGTRVRVSSPHTSFRDRTGEVIEFEPGRFMDIRVKLDGGVICPFGAWELEVM